MEEFEPLSVRGDRKGMRPAIRVDFSGAMPAVQLLIQMCWPQAEQAAPRLAKLGISMIGEHEEFRHFLGLLADLGSAPNSTRADLLHVLHEQSPDRASRDVMLQWIATEPFAAFYKTKLPDLDPVDAFLIALRLPAIQRALRGTVPDSDLLEHLGLVAEQGGLKAVTRAPSMAEIDADVATALRGAPIRAGCLLALFCRMQRHPAAGAPSINRACEVIEKVRGIGASRSTTMDDWKQWKPVAPIWAGLVAAAGHVVEDPARLQDALKNPDGPMRVMQFGKWFAEFATKHWARNADGPLISPTEVLEIDPAIEALEPPLPPLPPPYAGVAAKYMSATLRKRD